LCYGGKNKSTIVFVNTKKECNELMISDKIKQEVQIIHGDINQHQREATITGFKSGKFKCLIATDVASRGLDIPMVDLVIQSEPPKEVDTYIHRAGRTARAGRTGTCITLFTKFTEELIRRIENKAKISFKRIGAPQRNELIESSIRDVTTSINKIDESVIHLFTKPAKQLLDVYQPDEIIARLLAYVSGHTDKMKSRSVLCGAEGYITYSIKCNSTFQHSGYIWSLFKRILPENIRQKVRGLRQFKTMDGCVFDFPEEGHTEFEEIVFNDKLYGINYTLTKTEELPELVDVDEKGHSFGNNSGFRNNGRNDRQGDRFGGGDRGHNLRSSDKGRRDERLDIFIGNLASTIETDKIKSFIENSGIDTSDVDVRLVIDKETGNKKGFGFITTFRKDIYDRILQLNGKMLLNRSVRINDAKSK
jgi:ATP-dependent RNA helicase DDX21